jgi:flagellar biosynthesis regulator FlbT
MQVKVFHHLLQNPTALNEEQLKDLQHIIEKYPYFQSAYLLLLKHYYTNNHIDFEDALKLTVVYSTDRSKVRNYLREDFKQNISVVEENQLANETSSISAKPQQKRVFDPLLDQLNQQILSEAVNFSLQQEVEEDIKTLPEESLIKTIVVEENVKQDFYLWLSKPKAEVKTKLKYEHLIDKFLTDQPRIVPKKEFYSPINMARKSVEEDETIVSETLANLYVQQGHYTKALKAFQQLILKFPKKRTYFAARIYEIEELKKNKKS